MFAKVMCPKRLEHFYSPCPTPEILIRFTQEFGLDPENKSIFDFGAIFPIGEGILVI